MDLLSNNNNKDEDIDNEDKTQILIKKDIQDLNEKLLHLKQSNEKLELKNKSYLNSKKITTPLRIRILESQEILLKNQIQQLIDNPIKPVTNSNNSNDKTSSNSNDNIKILTEIELVKLNEQLDEYLNFLNQDDLKRSIDELENEKRLLNTCKEIGDNLIKNQDLLKVSKEILTEKVNHLSKKEIFQTKVLINFLNNYSINLYQQPLSFEVNENDNDNDDEYEDEEQHSLPKKRNKKSSSSSSSTKTTTTTTTTTTTQKSNRHEILAYVLEQLMNHFVNDPNGYISIRDPILRTPPQSNNKNTTNEMVSINQEIDILSRSGIIEFHPNEQNLIKIVPFIFYK